MEVDLVLVNICKVLDGGVELHQRLLVLLQPHQRPAPLQLKPHALQVGGVLGVGLAREAAGCGDGFFRLVDSQQVAAALRVQVAAAHQQPQRTNQTSRSPGAAATTASLA